MISSHTCSRFPPCPMSIQYLRSSGSARFVDFSSYAPFSPSSLRRRFRDRIFTRSSVGFLLSFRTRVGFFAFSSITVFFYFLRVVCSVVIIFVFRGRYFPVPFISRVRPLSPRVSCARGRNYCFSRSQQTLLENDEKSSGFDAPRRITYFVHGFKGG